MWTSFEQNLDDVTSKPASNHANSSRGKEPAISSTVVANVAEGGVGQVKFVSQGRTQLTVCDFNRKEVQQVKSSLMNKLRITPMSSNPCVVQSYTALLSSMDVGMSMYSEEMDCTMDLKGRD